jgi:5-methyltetrahydrofolate--homocysteine methyltransferase
MLKDNWKTTFERFDRWWQRKDGTVLLAADLRRPSPVYSGIQELTDVKTAFSRISQYLESGSFYGDVIPDMSSYLGPGSLCTFIGAEPIYSDDTIWYESNGKSIDDIKECCIRFLNSGDISEFPWYGWSIKASNFYLAESEGEFMVSMPDLQQNLDILAAVMGPERMFIELMDNPSGVFAVLECLYLVWEKAFTEHHEIIKEGNDYTAYTHYNIAGKGKTSVLQSDISCMMSKEMFDMFELPFLRKQCEILDNVIYHLDGPGAVRHLDSILSIEKINAVQWVPGSGNPGNADACWHHLYDKIVEKGKGLYVFLWPDEIDAFISKYGKSRILIRSLADTCEEQERLSDKYCAT